MTDSNLDTITASWFGEFMAQFRFADAIDIAIVSIAIYVLLSWFKTRWLELYLTTMLFQFGLIGSVFVFIVVFQQDIRHGLERIASSHWIRRSGKADPSAEFIETIVSTTEILAEQRVGALLVFPGREPLDPHIRGGVSVDSEISQPLLLSIFHPKSPGHDGAVLISEDRISRLGVHLPLTLNLMQLNGGGTRHAAALGLSERCDAMVVVVSEEQGTIKIAREGELTSADKAQLAERLRLYFSELTFANRRPLANRIQNWTTMSAAVVIATILWFVFAFQTATIQRTVVVPIEYRNLPEGWVVNEPKPVYAEVTLSGSEQAFRLLDASSLAVSLEIENPQPATPIRLRTDGSLRNVPSELTVNEVTPRSLVITLQKAAPVSAGTNDD